MPRMPQVTARELVRFLKSQGFIEDRQSGSHWTLWHEAQKISVTNKVWVAEFDGLCSVDQYVYEVDRSRTEPEYVAWFMRSPFYAGQAPVTTGPGQLPRIRLEEVAAVELELPDLGEQRRVVGAITNQVAAVERVRTAAEAQLEVADALKEALLRRAFSGEA